MNQPLRIVFAGTPDIATSHLQALVEAGHDIIAVYTQPDRPAGRGKKLTASSVKNYALSQDIPVYQPVNFKEEQTRAELAALEGDVMVVVAYGLLLPQSVLDIPTYGCLNVHGSILPRWRGAAPIQRAIWAGDEETGITIMQMDAGLDTGDMLNIATTLITADDTSATLYEKLSVLGQKPLLETLAQLKDQQLNPVVQNEAEVTYAEKLTKDEAKIDFKQEAAFITRCMRAFNPWPVSYFMHQEQAIKVWEGQIAQGQHNLAEGTVIQIDKTGLYIAVGQQTILVITRLQLPGKKAYEIRDLLNAKPDLFQEGMLITV